MTSGTSYGAEVITRRNAMRLARNAAFYAKHAHNRDAQREWRELTKKRVREARAANHRALMRIRDMGRDYVAPPPRTLGRLA